MSAPTAVSAAASVVRRAASSRAVEFLLCGVFFALYAAISLSRYEAFATRSWDLGIFVQVVRSYAEGRVPVSDLLGPGFVIFGDHFSPVLALLAPLYLVAPAPQTLLVAQAALFALSVLPVTRTAVRVFGNVAGRAVGVAYGLSWGVQRAVDFDFHEICFAVPLIAFSLEALLARRWWPALAWCAPLVLVKEDLCLTAAVMAGVFAWCARNDNRRFTRVAVVSAMLFVVAWACITLLIIPSFNPAGSYRFWNQLPGDGGLFASALNGAGEKISTVLWILLPTSGLLALRSPLALAVLPTLAWRFLASKENYWGTDWHYNAVLMPLVTVAMIDAVARLRTASPAWLRGYATQLPSAVLAAALSLSVMLPVGSLIRDGNERFDLNATAATHALSRIPDGATVEGNIATVAPLAGRCRVFWIGNTDGFAPDYIALHMPEMTASGLRDYVRSLHPETTYDIVVGNAGFWVLHRLPAGPAPNDAGN